jgi:hypothetical protein
MMWQTVKGIIAASIAFTVCPCHLPFTLPLLLTLTVGTAVGGWLAHNTYMVYLGSLILFVGGLIFAGKWLLPNHAT